MRLSQAYLLLYNAGQAVGWSVCAYQIASALLGGASPSQVYLVAGLYARMFQLLSALEIVHAAAGLVPSSPLNAAMQWAGRSNVLFLVLNTLPELQSSWWGVAMLACWSLAEVVRYPWYTLTLLHAAPHWLTWLRYSVFIPLYPVGVVSEMALIVAAVPLLRQAGHFSLGMPNALNWAFSYPTFLQGVLVVYPFLWWQLYSTLLRQRAKRLAAAPAAPKGDNRPSLDQWIPRTPTLTPVKKQA